MRENQDQTTAIPTLEEINNQFDAYQRDLDVRDLHLKLIFFFSTNEMDEVIELLSEKKEIDCSGTEQRSIIVP